METSKFYQSINSLLEEMIAQQRNKVLRYARDVYPEITHDDLMNPHDFPKIHNDPNFNFEDGLTAGLVSAQIAIRAFLNSKSS